jgi:hypothetical protein
MFIYLVLFHFVWVNDYWRRSGNGLAPIINSQTGAEFGDMTQILRNLGSCPPRLEFGSICEFSSRGNDAIYELFRLNTYEGLILVIFYPLTQFRGIKGLNEILRIT